MNQWERRIDPPFRWPLLPELILSIGGIILMMVAAFSGRRGSGPINWLAVALLIAATIALIGPPSHAGPVFEGQVSADLFASFGKVIIFLAAARAIIAAHGWFERGSEHASEYAVLIVFAAIGMSVMVSATSLISLYVGLELNSLAGYVLASYRRRDERSAEAGLKYFVLGALASGILLYGISLLYGFTGTTNFTGDRGRFRSRAPSLGLLFGLVFVLAGLAFKVERSAIPHVDPRRIRGRADTCYGLLRLRAKGRCSLASRRVCVEALGPATDAWRQIVIFAALLSIFLGAIAALRSDQHQTPACIFSINNVGFALVGLAAGGSKGASAVLFYMAVYVVMTLGAFLCVLWMRDKEGRPVESIESLSGLSQRRPGFALAMCIFMFSLAGIPPMFGFWPKLVVFTAAVEAGYVALAVAAILGTVIGAYYYLKIVKVMYLDEAAEPYAHVHQPVQGMLVLLAALIVSPIGYLLIGPLSSLTDRAAGSLF